MVKKSQCATVKKYVPTEVAHCFTAAVMTYLLEKICLLNPSSIIPNRWKSEGAKSRLSGGCNRTVQLRLTTCSMIFQLVWSLLLSPCKRKIDFFSSLTLELQAIISVNILVWWSELMVSPDSRNSWRITPFLSQKSVYTTLVTKGCLELFFQLRIHMLPLHRLLFWLWLTVLTPLIISNDASPSALYCFNRSWQTCIQYSFSSYMSICGTTWYKLCNILKLSL